MTKQYQLLSLLLILATCQLHGQYYFYNDEYYNTPVLVEAGLSAAAFNCLTDLGGSKGRGKRFVKDVNWTNTHVGGGLYLLLLIHQVFGLRIEGSFGKVSASDYVLKDDHSAAKDRFNRNLSFESKLGELSLTAEFHPLSLLGSQSYPLLSPYLMAGVGIFRFNPKANYNGRWVSLQSLHTEGQGFREYPERQVYKLTQMNFPTGFGLRYEISAIVNARAEVVYRFLKTDYLDDVSTTYIHLGSFHSNLDPSDAALAIALADRTAEVNPGTTNENGAIRGNPKSKDAYFSFNIKLGVVLNRKHR